MKLDARTSASAAAGWCARAVCPIVVSQPAMSTRAVTLTSHPAPQTRAGRLTDVLEAHGHAVQRAREPLRVAHARVQSLSLFAGFGEAHCARAEDRPGDDVQRVEAQIELTGCQAEDWDCAARGEASAWVRGRRGVWRWEGRMGRLLDAPSVRQLVASCASAAREMYASRTSEAVHSPAPMRVTISEAVENRAAAAS